MDASSGSSMEQSGVSQVAVRCRCFCGDTRCSCSSVAMVCSLKSQHSWWDVACSSSSVTLQFLFLLFFKKKLFSCRWDRASLACSLHFMRLRFRAQSCSPLARHAARRVSSAMAHRVKRVSGSAVLLCIRCGSAAVDFHGGTHQCLISL